MERCRRVMMVARLTFGLQHTTVSSIKKYKTSLSESEHIESLNQIAVVNLKKSNGMSRSDYDDISEYAEYDRAEIKKEIELIDSESNSLFGTYDVDKESAIEIDAKQAFNEIEENQVACKTKYDGKTVKITGTIRDISTNLYGQEYVAFETDDEWSIGSVQCFFKTIKWIMWQA